MSETLLSALFDDLSTSGVLSDELLHAGRDLVRVELRRRKTWTKSPELLGYQFSSWEEGGALDAIARDALDKAIIPWKPFLAARYNEGARIDGQVADLVRRFLDQHPQTVDGEWCNAHACVAAVIEMGVSEGWLQIVSGPPSVGPTTTVAAMVHNGKEMTAYAARDGLVSDPSFPEFVQALDTDGALEGITLGRAAGALRNGFRALMETTRKQICAKKLVEATKMAVRDVRRGAVGIAEQAKLEAMTEPDRDQRITVGLVLYVRDYLWGFDAPSRYSHPGACLGIDDRTQRATMLKGTDEQSGVAQSGPCYVVEPSATNGLTKPTAFGLEPRKIKLRPLELSAPTHTLGLLNSEEIRSLQQASKRANGRGKWAKRV